MFKSFVAACLTLVCLGVSAAEASKIAVINPQKATLSTASAQEKLKSLSQREDIVADQKAAEALVTEAKALYEKLQKEQSTMSPEQLQELSAKLQSKQGDIQHIEKKLVAAQQALYEEILKSNMPKYRQALETIIKKKEIGVLFPSETTIYASPDFDITAEVTELMNTL